MAIQGTTERDQCELQKQKSIRSIARQLQRPESSSYEAFAANFKPIRKSEGRPLRRAASSIYSAEDIWEERSPTSDSGRRRSESFDKVFASFANDVDSWSKLGSLPSLTQLGNRRTIDPEAAAELDTWTDQLLADYDEEDSVNGADSDTDRVWTPVHNGSSGFTTPEKEPKKIKVPQVALPEDDDSDFRMRRSSPKKDDEPVFRVPQVALPEDDEPVFRVPRVALTKDEETEVKVPQVSVEEEYFVHSTDEFPRYSEDVSLHDPDTIKHSQIEEPTSRSRFDDIELPRNETANPQARFSAIVQPVKPHVPLEAKELKSKKKKQKKPKKYSESGKATEKSLVTTIDVDLNGGLVKERAIPRGFNETPSEVMAAKDDAKDLVVESTAGAKPKQSKLGLLDRIDVLLFGELPPSKSPIVDFNQARERHLDADRPRLKVNVPPSAITNERFVLQPVPHGAHRRPPRPRRSPPLGANTNKELPPPPSPTSARRRTQNPGLGIQMRSRVEHFDLATLHDRTVQNRGYNPPVHAAAPAVPPSNDTTRREMSDSRRYHPPVRTRSRAGSRARRPRRKSTDTGKSQRDAPARQDMILRPAATFPRSGEPMENMQHDHDMRQAGTRDTATMWLHATDELSGKNTWV